MLLLAPNRRSFIANRFQLAKAMAEKYKVIVVLPIEDELSLPDCDNLTYIHIPFDRLSLSFFSLKRTICTILDLVDEHDIQYVFSYGLFLNFVNAVIGTVRPKLLVYTLFTGMGYFFSYKSFKGIVHRLFFLPLVAFIVSISKKCFVQNSKDFKLLGRLTLRKKIVQTDGSGLDSGYWRVENRLTRDVIRVVHISRMIEEKGIVEFAAVSELLKDNNRFEFFHYGDYDRRLRGSITEQEISNRVPGHRVKFMGFTKDVREVYENSEVLFFPSWREGFSRAVAEAMCCGVVPIVWNVPGCEDAVSSNLDGFVLGKGDINGVAEVLRKLSIEKRLLFELSSRAKSKARLKFDFNKINKKIIKNI